MNSCPCCSHQLLRHIRSSNVYWFCSHCRQEMPNFEYSSQKERALSPQAGQRRRSLDIWSVKLPAEAVQIKTSVAVKI